MPNDLDRYTQLLQNLAVSIGAIREAIEQAFGVTLPTATTLNAEFEIITTAMTQQQPGHDPLRWPKQPIVRVKAAALA